MKNKLKHAALIILAVLSLITITAVMSVSTARGLDSRLALRDSETTEEIVLIPAVIIIESAPQTEALTQETTVPVTVPETESETEQLTEELTEPVTEAETENTPETAYISDPVKEIPKADLLSDNAALALSDGTLIAVKGGDERIYPASITKVMTLILSFEYAEDLDDCFTVTREIIDQMYLQGAARAGFCAGETVTVRDLIYAAALPSGGDAALALALYVAGSEEEFVRMMNAKAEELGMKDTHFVNPVGLHDADHYSTVTDLVKLMSYAIRNDDLRQVMSTRSYTTSKTPQNQNGITMLSSVFLRIKEYPADGVTILGGKTGYTPEAGDCLATYARDSDGCEYIFVSVHAPDTYDVAKDAQYIYSNLKTFTE